MDAFRVKPGLDLSRLDHVTGRARALNLSLGALCVRAGAHFGTIRRWEKGETTPLLTTYEREMAKLESALAQEEARLTRALEAGR